MIIEIIAETIFPVIGRIIGYIVLEIICRIIFYTTGYVFWKIVTLGKKPKKYIPWYSAIDQETNVTITGGYLWLTLLILLIVYSKYYGV